MNAPDHAMTERYAVPAWPLPAVPVAGREQGVIDGGEIEFGEVADGIGLGNTREITDAGQKILTDTLDQPAARLT